MVRRQTEKAPLASTFVAVIEPYEETSDIAQIRRLPLETASGAAYPDTNVALEVLLADGWRDFIVAADVENPLGWSPSRAKDAVLAQKDLKLRLDGELCMIRQDQGGKVRRIALCRGRSVAVGDLAITLKSEADFVEVRFDDQQRASIVSGNPDVVGEIRQ